MDKRRSARSRRIQRRRRQRNIILAALLGGLVIILVLVAVAVSRTGRDKQQQNQPLTNAVSDAEKKTQEQTTNSLESQSAQSGEMNTENASTDNTDGTQGSLQVTAKGFSIQLIDGVTYVDGVLIANKTYGLPQSYAPGDLADEVKEAFEVMKKAAAKEGLNLYISSGYRSYTRQQTLYNNYVNKDGKEQADTYSARAGYSEHQSGLCFDLNTIDDSFAYTAESKWLEKHAQEYGFIIRYPKGKEDKTGYQYEPWHLRYLGVELATKVYESGLCLEEYYGITSEYAE